MADLSSITYTQNGTPGPYGGGGITVARGTFPTTASSATCPVGNLHTDDMVEIVALESKSGHVPFVRDKASDTASNTGGGIVTIKPMDASTTPSTCEIEVRVYRI